MASIAQNTSLSPTTVTRLPKSNPAAATAECCASHLT